MLYNSRSDPLQVRTRCRNPRCTANLKSPVADKRDAFCRPSCERAFYGCRCRVCEQLFSRKTKRQIVCGKDACRYQFKRGPERFFGSSSSYRPIGQIAHNEEKTSTKSTLKTGAKSGPAFRHVAGPECHPINYQVLAEIPASKANAAFEDYWLKAKRRAARKALIKFRTPPVNIVGIGAYRWPNAPAIDLSPMVPAIAPPIAPSTIIDNGLDGGIPTFLKRTAPAAPAIPEIEIEGAS